MTSKFDALALDVEKPSRLTIVHPVTRQPLRLLDDEGKATGTEAWIDLHSDDSAVARTHQRAITRKRLAMRGRGKLTPEELEAEQVELLVALTAGWHLVGLDGTPLDVPFSPENARELYSSNALAWIREQVDGHAGDRGNFSKA